MTTTVPLPTFEGLTFREPARADIPALVEHFNSIWPAYYATNEQEQNFDWDPFDPKGQVARVVGEADDRIVACASVRGRVRGDPDDSGYTGLDVACQWRRRGIGTLLHRYLEDTARAWGMRVLMGWSTSALPGGEEFLLKMGMKVVNRGSESHLNLETANFEPFRKQAEQLAREGYEFFTLADRDSPELRHQAHELSNYIDREMPTEGTLPQATSYEGWEKNIFGGNPGYSPRQVHVASKDGALVGMTAIFYQPSGYAYTITTGVRREHRGKGLAGALKYLSLTLALADGAHWTTTENAVQNAPMLAINRKLGYVHACDSVEFEKRLV